MNLPGSRQIGLAKRLFEHIPGSEFEPHPEWAALLPPPEPKDEPRRWGDWIWYPEGNPAKHAPAATRYFRRTFEIPREADRPGRAAALGRRPVDGLSQRPLLGLAHRLADRPRVPRSRAAPPAGKNVLAVAATNGNAPVPQNPAGLIGALEVELADGSKIVVRSDATWRRAALKRPAGGRSALTTGIGSRRCSSPATATHRGAEFGAGSDEFMVPYAAGIPGVVRIVYLPQATRPRSASSSPTCGTRQPGSIRRAASAQKSVACRPALKDRGPRPSRRRRNRIGSC